MPSVKPLTETERKNNSLREQIIGKMKTAKISSEVMAERMGVSLNTFYRHRDSPDKLTLRELRILMEVFPDIVIR